MVEVARIEWTRLSGDDVEAVISMLLCGDNFDAWRVQPGRGDGGIDVFVPVDGTLNRRRVYQVKRFAERLTSSHRRQIKQSLRRVLDASKADGWQIEHWYLVTPLDMTPNELKWFAEITKDLTCGSDWIGLNRVEYLAARQPAVIDYYLRDGKDRLAAQTDALAGIIAGRQNRATGDPLRPEDIRGDLAATYRAINECDPHYHYGISVMPRQPDPSQFAGEPGLVAVSSSGSDSVGWVTIAIFARCRESLIARPITAELQMLTADETVADEYKRFLDLGVPVSLPAGAMCARLNLPGGMATEVTSAEMHFSVVEEPLPEDGEAELILAIFSGDDKLLSELHVDLVSANPIPNGGRRTVWKDSVGFIEIEISATKFPNMTFNMKITQDAVGKVPSKVAPSLKFISNMHDPNKMGLAAAYGPRDWSMGHTSGWSEGPDPSARRLARYAEALATIQEHTQTRLLIPSSYTRDQAVGILNAARLLSGEPVGITWTDGIRFDREAGETQKLAFNVGDELLIRAVSNIVIELDDAEVVVGRQMTILEARLTELPGSTLAAVPVEGSESWLVRFDGDDDAGLDQISARPA